MGKAIAEPTGTKHCPICGKEFFVQWPQMWTYRRGDKTGPRYLCSWSCLRAWDQKKEEGKMDRFYVKNEQKTEAVRIALAGGSPLDYLKQAGSKNPTSAWYTIKRQVEHEDPETFAKLPAKLPSRVPVSKKPVETPEGEYSAAGAMKNIQDAADEFFGKCKDMGMNLETPEKPLPVQDLKLQPGGNYRISVETPEAPKIYKPVVYDGMTIREVEGGFGRYRRSDVKDSVYIDFENAEGMDVLSLTVDQWRGFREEQMKAAMILGVAL